MQKPVQSIPLIVSILSMLCCLQSPAADIWEVPYHPYRKVGDKYYGLQPIYNWIKLAPRERDKKVRPMPAWKGGPSENSSILAWYRVKQIVPEGIIVEQAFVYFANLDPVDYGSPFLLQNFPDKASLVDKQEISFLALPVGTFTYTGVDHADHTIPKYDYGIPYNPGTVKPASPVAGK